MTEPPRMLRAPCSTCLRETDHRILQEDDYRDAELDLDLLSSMIKCAGCGTVSLRQRYHRGETEAAPSYYPPPRSRPLPSWFWRLTIVPFHPGEPHEIPPLPELMRETYEALRAGQYRLAAMGLRAIIDVVLAESVGDLGDFPKKLDAAVEAGHISKTQREALDHAVQLGHAATHRGFKPEEEEMSLALDVVEGVIAALYYHKKHAAKLSARVPPRVKKEKAKPAGST